MSRLRLGSSLGVRVTRTSSTLGGVDVLPFASSEAAAAPRKAIGRPPQGARRVSAIRGEVGSTLSTFTPRSYPCRPLRFRLRPSRHATTLRSRRLDRQAGPSCTGYVRDTDRAPCSTKRGGSNARRTTFPLRILTFRSDGQWTTRLFRSTSKCQRNPHSSALAQRSLYLQCPRCSGGRRVSCHEER